MVIKRRKKVVKYRRSKTHGGGAKKKRRGAGSRGGRGMAGSGKRADQKKPSILKKFGSSYFGKHGFKRPKKQIKKIKVINLGLLEKNLDKYLKKKLIKKENSAFILNLSELGYDKLLSAGNIKNKYDITTKFSSKKAKSKIEKLGGKVNVVTKEHTK